MFEEIEDKLLETMNVKGLNKEELNKFFDKKVKLSRCNKMGEELFLYRHTSSKQIAPGYFNNNAKYYVINTDGRLCGKIDATVQNDLAGDNVELEYFQGEAERNKGNISIALEEVIKDIFLNKPLNGKQIKPNVISDIKRIFLAINEDNLASRKVAEKTGFKLQNSSQYGMTYEITLAQYLERLKKQKEEQEGQEPGDD